MRIYISLYKVLKAYNFAIIIVNIAYNFIVSVELSEFNVYRLTYVLFIYLINNL